MKSKKLGKITPYTKARISSPFIYDHKTEKTGTAILMAWMREIIERNNIDLGLPDVETKGGGRYPDTLIYKTRRSRDALCEIEFKIPQYDPFDENLKNDARDKANRRRAKYFATSNFKVLILWNTEKVNAQKPEEEQMVAKFNLSEISDLDFIGETPHKNSILNGLTQFLNEIYQIFTGEKSEPQHAIDELLIWRLQEKIKKLSYHYQNLIYDEAHKNDEFLKSLAKWFNDQGWSFFPENEEDYGRAARQTAYLLVNKILFYNALQRKRPDKLDKLKIPDDVTKSGLLHSILQGYFDQVLKIDYETIYTADFIDQLAFPESLEVVEEIKDLTNILQKYDFSTLGFDVIGRIFERLIPPNERHKLGQYFTNPDIVDLITKFCLKHEDDKVFDPSCGAGTFLVRAYQHKKLMNQNLSHEKIIGDLWGDDIAKFPATLAIINLAINGLEADKNYPNILQKDFFDLETSPETGIRMPENYRLTRAKTLGIRERDVEYPRWFDCIVGNPPYTRQEEIAGLTDEVDYKGDLISKALSHAGHKIAAISRRAGIYAYFFVHGSKFLKNKGRFGFIVSNAWLDVEYGAGLQEFFLNNYKIVAIIESKVERWFEDADINTCIVILEKATGSEFRKERENNLVRFVYLQKPLRNFIPPAQDIWEKQIDRLRSIDNLIKTILGHDEFYQNDDLRIYPKKQSDLYEEGYDTESNKYIGSKWGKYVRAPEIFFKILEQGKDKLVPLKQIADVRFGIKTGANEFFYLTADEIKRRKIEKEFWMHQDKKGNWVPNYVIKSPRECRSIIVNPQDLKYRVLMIHKDKKGLKGTNVLKYIMEGERKGFHLRPTCASRGKWYDIGLQVPPDMVWFKAFNDRVFAPLNIFGHFTGDRLYAIYLKNPSLRKNLSLYLNSTLAHLMVELWGRVNLGEGALDNMTYEAASMLVVVPDETKDAMEQDSKKFFSRPILSVFEELGVSSPQEAVLDKVKPDRRELDKIIMGEILGLTEEEQFEVYKAVIDLVKSRIEKAKSLNNKTKTKKGLNINALIDTIVEKVGENTISKFYQENILNRDDLITKKLPEIGLPIKVEKGLFGWQVVSGKSHFACHSENEARYLKIWLDVGQETIKMPKDQQYLEKVVGDLETLKSQIDQTIENYLSSILDQKLKAQILHQVWQKLLNSQ